MPVIYAQILSKCQELEEQILSLTKQLQNFPDGELRCTSNGKHYKWYHHHGNGTIYLPKSQKDLAKQLAHKKYLCAMLEDLSREKHAMEAYLNHHNADSHTEKVLAHPEIKQLLTPAFKPLSQDLAAWASSEYERNPNHPEHLVHKSCSGNIVRSKSEAIIDMLLYTHKIPYRYECALQLGDFVVYPDFTLRHPITGNLYYWEHFGQMDTPAYATKAYSKLQLYSSHGIIPSIHLITTYETKTYPLTPDTVEKVIALYFGS